MRIYIIGTEGSGKTTLARKLSQLHDLKHIELDHLYWLPNWERSDSIEFIKKVKDAIQGDDWVACGNYPIVQPYIMEQADRIIWLDYSFWCVASRIVKRVIKCMITGKCLIGPNKVNFYQEFFTKESVFLWVINGMNKGHRQRKLRYLDMMTKGAHKDKWERINE